MLCYFNRIALCFRMRECGVMNKLSLGIFGWLLIGTLSLLLGPFVIAFIITFIAFLAVLAIPVIIFAFIVKVFVLVFRA